MTSLQSQAGTDMPDIRYIPLVQVHESPLNTRKHFDPAKLQELATSMKGSRQLTPVLVRPSTMKGKTGFELASGHRRRRAAEIAGLDSLMAIVRELDDATFLEILTIDNLQREDVHPLEEAQGYKNLLTIDGYDPKRIAERVGKSESYVYDRLKLLQLIPAAQLLFLENRFSLGHAVLLSRLGSDEQKRCLAVQDEDGSGLRFAGSRGGMWEPEGSTHPVLGFEDPSGVGDEFHGHLKPVSVRQLQAWIDNHVRFTAPDPALPHLFADTTEKLAAAEESKAKVLQISRDHQLQNDAKDPEGKRTYCSTSWKRADGEVEKEDWWDEDEIAAANPSVRCEHSVLGVVVAGPGRGESFHVCVDKKRCTTHWGDEIRERNKRERAREKDGGAAGPKTKATASSESSWQREDRLRKERNTRAKARWDRGGDAVLRAIAPSVRKLAIGGTSHATKYFLDLIGDGLYGLGDTGKKAAKLGVPLGSTSADLVRHLIMVALVDRGSPGGYNDTNEEDLQEDLNALKIKIDVAKMLGAANPEPVKAAAKVEPKAKKTAGRNTPAKKVAKKSKSRT